MPVEEKKHKKSFRKWKWLFTLIIILVAIGLFIYYCMRITHIEPGYVGVKSSIDNPVDENTTNDVSLVNGYVVYIPLMTNLEVYPTSVFSYDLGKTQIYTKDGISLGFSPKVSLQLDPTKADLYYNNFKSTNLSKNEHIAEAIINVFTNTASTFDTDSLIRHKIDFEKQLEKELSDKLSKYALLVKNVNSNLEYPTDVRDRVELKLKIEQDILVAETEAKLAYIKAESRRQQDSLEYSTLSKLSIQKLFIDKWDGRLAPNPEQPIMYRDINSNEGISNEAPAQEKKEKESKPNQTVTPTAKPAKETLPTSVTNDSISKQ